VPTEAEGSTVKGLADKIDQLIHEGNVRRVVVRDKQGRTVLDVPVTVGLVALFVAPMITTAASALALAGGWRLEVERTEPAVVAEPPAEPSEGD
jgi:predicted regulator of Ras-like GTPase activity (Roadblock/LC7/MglB family)